MSPSPRASRRALLAGFVLAVSTLAITEFTPPADAHGSTQEPASRAYVCRFEQPDNPMCAAAWSANSQALYDWMEVNIGDAAGRHRQLIPDGQLCSAGRSKYGALDRPGAWPVTALRADGAGLVDLVYENTAPHSTAYYRVYITRTGFDARTDALAWDDLQLVYDSGPLERSARQVMRAPIPERAVPAILYIVWQRSDSPEAFYACSDVTVSNGAPGTTSPPSTTATTTPPTTRATTSTTRGSTVTTASTVATTTPTTLPSSVPVTSRPADPANPSTRPTRQPGTTPTSTESATGSDPSVVVVTAAPAGQQGSTSSTPSTASASADQTPVPTLDEDTNPDAAGLAVPGTGAPRGQAPLAVTTPQLDGTASSPEADETDEPDETGAEPEQAAAPSGAGSAAGGRWLLLAGAVGLGSLGLVLVGYGLGAPAWRRRGAGLLHRLGGGPPIVGLAPSRRAPSTDHYDVRHVGRQP